MSSKKRPPSLFNDQQTKRIRSMSQTKLHSNSTDVKNEDDAVDAREIATLRGEIESLEGTIKRIEADKEKKRGIKAAQDNDNLEMEGVQTREMELLHEAVKHQEEVLAWLANVEEFFRTENGQYLVYFVQKLNATTSAAQEMADILSTLSNN